MAELRDVAAGMSEPAYDFVAVGAPAFASGNAYIVAGDEDSNWVQNIRANPRVVLSVDGQLIDAVLTDVTANEELNSGVRAFLKKYEMDEEDFVREDGLMFRLNKP